MLDLTKPVQTRDGRKARVICTDRKHRGGTHCVVALVTEVCGKEIVNSFDKTGRYSTIDFKESCNDLIQAPVVHKRCIAWTRTVDGIIVPYVYVSKEAALADQVLNFNTFLKLEKITFLKFEEISYTES